MKKTSLFLLGCGLLFSCTGHDENVMAHRGFCTEKGEVVVDENTLDALRRAQDIGAEAVEFDVHMTSDSALVIRHDAAIEGTLNCQRSTFEEIRAHRLPFGGQIPTLQEWLEQCKHTPEMMLCIEIKGHKDMETEVEVIRRTIAAVKAEGLMGVAYFLTFNSLSCDEILRQEPSARVVYNSGNVHDSVTPDVIKSRGYYGVSYNAGVWVNHPEWAKRCTELGIVKFMYMVNDKFAVDMARKLGISWFCTDYYDLIKPM